MNDRRRQPAYMIAILAALGATSLPQVWKNQGNGAGPSAPPKPQAPPPLAAAAEAREEHDDLRDLRPLLDYLSPAGSARPADADHLGPYLEGKYPEILPGRGQDPSVHCLVVTLPDPVAGAASDRFDEFLDVVQRAVEVQGFILDRSELPWRPTPGPTSPPDRVQRIRSRGGTLDLRVETTTAVAPKAGRPGLILFKEAFPKPGMDPVLLLVFVVPESPILGVDKAAFERSLGLIDRYFYQQLTCERACDGAGPAGPRRIVHIVAPCFSGSQRSLEVAIGQWKDPGSRPYHFRILSNNAGSIDRARIEGICAGGPRRRVSFRSMVHETNAVAEKMLGFINEKLGYDPSHVALLIESNSGLVQALAERVWKMRLDNETRLDNEFIFPLQVSEVRKAYERQGLLDANEIGGAGHPDRLPIPPDESGEPTDLPRSFTPSSSAAFDELALTQVLTTIGHRRYHAVGIIASNPFDVVFLARRVRRFCPNVRLFALQADLLFARSQNVGDLRGMLVASTYSLYPSNQWAIMPYDSAPRVLFNDQGAQGLYNAIVAHLWEMDLIRGPDDTSPEAPPLLDFGMPYQPRCQGDRPPVWIGSVGERGIFPVASLPVQRENGYLYDATGAPDERRSAGQPATPGRGEEQRIKAMRPNAHLLYWFVGLLLFFVCAAVTGLTWVYVRWSTDPAKTRPEPGPAGLGFGRALRALNCEVAPEGYAGDTYDPQDRYRTPEGKDGPFPPTLGSGIYLFLINLLIMSLAHDYFSYLLVAMIPHAGHPSLWFYVWFGTSLASVVLVFASSALALAERLAARRWLGRWRHAIFAGAILLASLGWWWFLATADVRSWRLDFERISNLPNGVSPLFPLLFLVGSIASWIHSQVAGRRLYRLSYLPAAAAEDVPQESGSQPERRLRRMRKLREDVDRLIVHPTHALSRVHPVLPWALLLLLLLLLIRTGTRGIPRSFEGLAFDRVFWSLVLLLILLTVIQTLRLLALWGRIRDMLQLAVTLPMAQAFDRIPRRIRRWFYGAQDFATREELVVQQCGALRRRTTPELAAIYQKLFPRGEGEWVREVERVRGSLEHSEGTLDSTRSVYPLLDPFWDAIPVEEVVPQRTGESTPGRDVEWTASWPLLPSDRARLDADEHRILRDWVQLAEDLTALQIVRWFAPASSQLLPMIRFLVVGPLLLLLAITSYPFDHAGWVMTVMVTLLLFVAWVVGVVLVGTDRDELISRVSDTAPGRLSLDTTFVSSILTTMGPLLAALLAISFDLSDLLHTWFGPIFQLL